MVAAECTSISWSCHPSPRTMLSRNAFAKSRRRAKAPLLATLKTFGARRSPGLLSFPMQGTTLALDFRNRGQSTLALLDRLDAVVLEAKGRLYPAKDGRMSAQMFRSGYPSLAEFARHIDPVFRSDFWKRVGM